MPIADFVNTSRLRLPGAAARVALSLLGGTAGLLVGGCAPQAEPPSGPPVVRVALPTGVELRYTEQGPAGGEPVVLLHGYADSSFSFSRILPLLPGSLRVLAVDQRGHGRSTKNQDSHTMADLAADVVAFLDAMRIEQATLVGHSTGGTVAQKVAIAHPERVRRLVLIGAVARGGNPVMSSLLDEVRALADPIDPAFVREFQRSTLFTSVPEAFLDQVIAESMTVPAAIWQQVLADFVREDTTSMLDRIRAPTLLLWGEHDALFTRAEQELLARHIPRAELRVLPDVGHAPHWERPEQVADEVVAFLRATGGAR